MPSAATPSEPIPCSSFVEDPFEQEDLLSLMPKSFEGLLNLDFCDPSFSEQDLHRLLSDEVLKKRDKETQEGNAILTGMANLETADIYGDTALLCKPESQQSENLEKMAEEPALFKENMPPNENFPHPRLRREGSGRVSNRAPFTIMSSSFGSNLNVQKDPRTLQDVYEFFADAERQENAEAIIRKMRGEKSPIAFCSQQSLKTRVRRQGTGRRKPNMNFDVKLVADTEKYIQLDGEKLEVEEYPVSSFTRGAEQDCDIPIETGDKKINKDVSFNVSGHEQCLSETVNDDSQNQRDGQSESNRQNNMQSCDQLSIGHGREMDDLQLNPVQGKEICGSETEETVNMPPKNLFSFENSARSAFHQLLKDYMKLDGEKMLQAPFSRSELEINDNGNPYPKDVHYDTQCALSQSQAESSNTIHSQCLCADEVKTMIQPHQIPSDFHLAGSDRTPPEDFSQKARETCSPPTSPTPPSNISAALKPGRKRKSVGSGKSRVPCISPLQDRDKEAAKDRTSSTSHVLRTLNLSIQGVSSGVRRLNFDIPSNSPKQAELKSSEGLENGNATNLVKSSENDDKKSGVMRPRFDSPSKSPKQDEFNSGERLDDGEAVNLVNPSTNCSNNEKVEVVRTDVDLSNVTMLSPQKIIQVNSTGPCNSNALASANLEHAKKDALVLASGQQNEESPLTLHKKNTKKVKRQAKKNAITCDCDAREEDKITSKEAMDREKKKRSSEYKRRQSLAGAGTLWKSGVRRSTRIRSRPLEYWRGERFLYGRIHNSLTTVIGIKYTSPGPSKRQKKEAPNFKVKSYVDDQYSHMVDFAASH